MSPKTAQRVNGALVVAIATMALAALAHFGAIISMIENKAEAADMHENRQRITGLEAACRGRDKVDDRIFKQLDRLETKLDNLQTP